MNCTGCRSHGRGTQGGNTVTGVAVGLLIGVVIAVGVALYINFGPKPFVSDQAGAAASQSAPSATTESPVALPGKPGDRPVEKPQYDFYKILPGGDGSAPAPTANAEPAPERLFLQAGAFHDPSEADNLKARLALMGMEAGVQRAEIPDRGVLHRVRVGPFASAADADAARARLAQEGIETTVVQGRARSAASTPAAQP